MAALRARIKALEARYRLTTFIFDQRRLDTREKIAVALTEEEMKALRSALVKLAGTYDDSGTRLECDTGFSEPELLAYLKAARIVRDGIDDNRHQEAPIRREALP